MLCSPKYHGKYLTNALCSALWSAANASRLTRVSQDMANQSDWAMGEIE